MAVKQHSIENNQERKEIDFNKILEFIERFENDQLTPDLRIICENIVEFLSYVEVPSSPDSIKVFQKNILKVDEFLAKLTQSEEMLDIIKNKFFSLIMSTKKIDKLSGAVGIVLNHLTSLQSNNWLLAYSSKSDESIKKAVTTLCQWIPCSFFIKDIECWIIRILNGLREEQKFDLLFNISLENIEIIFRSFLLPYYTKRAAPVLQLILSSVRHDPSVFLKVVILMPKADSLFKSNLCTDTQHFIETILALMEHFPGNDDAYKPIQAALTNFAISHNVQGILNVPPWHDPSKYIKIYTNARVGLVNLGNTCYMNSVLQALVMTKQFSREILLSNNRAPLFQNMQKLLALLLHSVRPELTPMSVLWDIRPPGFHPGHQQDSSEFLGHLLETLHEQEKPLIMNAKNSNNHISTENKTVLELTPITSQYGIFNMDVDEINFDDSDDEQDGAHAIKPIASTTKQPVRSASAKTLIQKTFSGKISITYKCLNCCTESKQFDAFRDLQLSFPDTETASSNYSVQDLLDYYCSTEKLVEDNKYFCDQCKMLCDGERFINILNAPQNLILTLKHFKYDQKYNTRAKLMHKVYHDETISIKVGQNEENEPITVGYRLYAAVVHSGISMDSGHYYTYGADQPDCWYKFNDNYVTNSSISELHNLKPPNTPYILFYQMVTLPETGSSSYMMRHNSSLSNSSSMDTARSCINNQIVIKYEFPALEELSPVLREYVNRDNQMYRKESRSHNYKQNLRPINGSNNYRDPDNDDPPNSCGGSVLSSYNRYIF